YNPSIYSTTSSQFYICLFFFFFFNATAPSEIYTLSLHDALPIFFQFVNRRQIEHGQKRPLLSHRNLIQIILVHRDCHCRNASQRSEEHTSELQSRGHLVCRLLLEKKKKKK